MPRGMKKPGVFRELIRAWCGWNKVAVKEVESTQEHRGLCLLLKDY